MDLLKKLRLKSPHSKSGLKIIVLVAVLVELTSIVQYWFASKSIREEVEHRAETELHVKNLEIQNVMVAVETAINNTVWTAEQLLEQPDSLYGVLAHLVTQNPTIVGAGLMFIADYYPQKGHWFEPYVVMRADSTLESSNIGSATHDYFEAEFFRNGMEADGGYWSEPYFDDAGAKMMLCTYTRALHDASGRAVALIGADVSLDWLSDVINARQIYPSSYNVILSREGQVMACPVESLVMRSTAEELASDVRDSNIHRVNRQMMSGESGHSTIKNNSGENLYVFYAPVDAGTGWSMAVVCSDNEIYRGLRQVGFNIMLLMIAGMALLCYIIYRVARNIRAYEDANSVKERIGNELRIARGIQESMLPKIFPPYPERDDIDIFSTLTPAKEVGGDLYDFFIRNGRLFFCIGDVSGKGIPASLVMAVTRSLFRTVASHQDLPADIVKDINASMAEMNDSDMFVTLFVGALDLESGKMQYCNAGHEAPLLAGQGIGILPTDNNIPVGLMAEWDYKGMETQIYPLTTLFLYTDGLTEAENAAHEQFGKQRMVEMVRQAMYVDGSYRCSPQSIISFVTSTVNDFVGDAEQYDDLTMLAIRYTPKESPLLEGK